MSIDRCLPGLDCYAGVPVCVAPTFPEWVTDEYAEVVWIRSDLAHDPKAVIGDEWIHAPPTKLLKLGAVVMVRDAGSRDDDYGYWLADSVSMWEAHPDEDSGAVYIRFEVVEADA